MTKRSNEQKVTNQAFEECADYFRDMNGERNWCLVRDDRMCAFASD